MARYSKKEIAESLEDLKKWIKPGDTVYTILRHVSRSGMRRVIGLVIFTQDAEGRRYPLHPNWRAGCVTGRKVESKTRDGVVIDGCGMDMGFALVDELSFALGYRTKETALRHEWL